MVRSLSTRALTTRVALYQESAEPTNLQDAGSDKPSDRLNKWCPPGLVAAIVAFNLVELRAERNYTPMLNDGSMHAQMVRDAAYQLAHGHLPLETWYPFLGLGSPQFLHYQSLGAMLAGAIGLLVGPDRAFSWSLYLLLCLWPVSIYWAARILSWERWTAALAATFAPFILSVPGIGYEATAYVWTGYGVWAQLLAMWTLPLSWAFTWQAVSKGRYVLPAVVLSGLTIALHFETGYLALLPIGCWVVLDWRTLLARVRRASVTVVATLLVTAWVIVPLVLFSKWASVNEFLVNTPDANSYGARQVLTWAVTGRILDAGRLPVLTVLAGVGLLTCLFSWKKDERSRMLLAVFALSLLLFFGRPTLGPIIDLIPGTKDLFLRRFIIGVQLSALLLAGVGATTAVRSACQITRRTYRHFSNKRPAKLMVVAGRVAVAAALFVGLAPAWGQAASYDSLDGRNLEYQRSQDVTAGSKIGALVARMQALGPGRVFSGLPYPSWGSSFTVGAIPVFKYLSNLDLDVVGYTLRTASLMTDPEAYFDESNPGDYSLFGIRYLVLPLGRVPVPKATFLERSGNYLLYELPAASYVQVIETTTPIFANRANIGARSVRFLDSALPGEGIYPTVAYAGAPAQTPTLSSGARTTSSPGFVVSEGDDLQDGQAGAIVQVARRAAVVLKVSFDPGWSATVDGALVRPYMVAPAMVAVTVGPGRHVIIFRYRGFSGYPLLFAIALLTLVGLLLAPLASSWSRQLQKGLRHSHPDPARGAVGE
jgi:hypothetical protein